MIKQISKDIQLIHNEEGIIITQNHNDDIDVIKLELSEVEKLAFEIEQMIRVNKALGNL